MILDWLTSDGPATWLGLLSTVGAGTFVASTAAARARMRLEDRRQLWEHHLPTLNSGGSLCDHSELRTLLTERYTFEDENDLHFILSGVAVVRTVAAVNRIVPLLSFAERKLWSEVTDEIRWRSEEVTAFDFLSMSLEAKGRLPVGFQSGPEHPNTFKPRRELPFLNGPAIEAMPEFGGITSVERMMAFVEAKLNPRFSNMFTRRTGVARALWLRATGSRPRVEPADMWEWSVEWADIGV